MQAINVFYGGGIVKVNNHVRTIHQIEKIDNDFKDLYPTYDGLIIADGGIQRNHLNSLEDIGVDIAVQGGAIFG